MTASWQEIFDLGDRADAGRDPSRRRTRRSERAGRLPPPAGEPLAQPPGAGEEISASLFDRIDEETWERLEEPLILADVGAPTTAEIVERLERDVDSGAVPADGAAVQERLIEILAELAAVGERRSTSPPSRRC